MNKLISTLFVSLAGLSSSGVALADATTSNAPMSQLVASKPIQPVMSHEVATLIKFTHQAQAQYRRSGSPQDLARVNAMRIELANRGFGRATQWAPMMMTDAEPMTSYSPQAHAVVVSSAQ